MQLALAQEQSPVFGRRYTVEGTLARGSSGTVYRARDSRTGAPVALKVLERRPGVPGTSSEVTAVQFAREAALLARVRHPNVVSVLEYGREGDAAFVAMELVEGTTLQALVASGSLTPARLVAILDRVCEGVACAHDAGVIHRDLKPANILVAADGTVKVVDFGLAKEVGDAVSMTGDGLLLGTPLYMAPEQIRGRPLDRRCDVYAVGVCLYEGLAGRPPFARPQTAATLMAHLNEQVPPLQTFAPDLALPATADLVVARCLAKARADRFNSLHEVRAALDLLAAALDDPAADAAAVRLLTPAPGREARQRVSVGAALTAALLFSGAAAFGYVVIQGAAAILVSTAPPPPLATVEAPPEAQPQPAEPFEPVQFWQGPVESPPEPARTETPAPEAPVPRARRPVPARPAPVDPPVVEGPLEAPEPTVPAEPAFPRHGTDLKNPFHNVERR
ncbi:MAG: protein kinase [Alphaproteobacteria bacterium]|nr:protein kinase [Alphaproteobacteria bacterium]MCB9693301.1 protein kinase [Alphaproteobacteria bacterium]